MLVLPIAVAALIPICLFTWVAIDQRAATLSESASAEQRLVEALAQHTNRVLSTQALILNIVDHAAADRSCDQLRTDAALQGFVEMLAQEATLTRALWIIDGDGFLCMSSSPNKLDTKTRADRDYFILARQAGPGRFAVGQATFGRIDGQPIFNFAKARTKNGAFNGVILVSPGLDDLLDDWRKEIGFGPSERIELMSKDGGTVARSWSPLVPNEVPPTPGAYAPWRAKTTGVETVTSPSDSQATSSRGKACRNGAWLSQAAFDRRTPWPRGGGRCWCSRPSSCWPLSSLARSPGSCCSDSSCWRVASPGGRASCSTTRPDSARWSKRCRNSPLSCGQTDRPSS